MYSVSGGEVSYRSVIIKKASSLVGGSDYDNLDGRFATRGKEREKERMRESKKRVRISPAAEQGTDNKTLAGFTRRRINGFRSAL